MTLGFAGTLIHTRGPSAHKKETQYRIAGPLNTSTFDPGNDWSFTGASADPTTPARTARLPGDRDGVLVFGEQPPG